MSELSDLQDRNQIIDLVARLNRWLDDGPVEDAATVYTDDALVTSPRGAARGIDEVIEYVRRTSSPDERTQHFTTDLLVGLDGDRADVTANLLVCFFRIGVRPHRTVGLRYAFDAVRTGQTWRFARAEVTPMWFQES
jgi:hypothetical protein